jgi:hypothetical protein
LAGGVGRFDAELGECGQAAVQVALSGGAIAAGEGRSSEDGVGILGPAVGVEGAAGRGLGVVEVAGVAPAEQ